jgi:hypothetical protein
LPPPAKCASFTSNTFSIVFYSITHLQKAL